MTRFHRKSIRTAILALGLLGSLLVMHGSAHADHGNSPLPSPNPFRYVVDNAGVIDSATNQRMEKILRALKESGDIEFAVVTVKTTGDQDIFDYSLAVARGWFIQVSRHLEGHLPDGLVGEAGRRMRDPFRRADYSNGLMAAVQTIVSTLQEKRGFSIGDVDQKYAYRPSAEPVRETGRSFSPWLFLIAIFVIIMLISSRSRGGRGGGGGGWLNWLLLSMVLNSGNRGSGWGGSSGSSGWSGGGFGGSGGGGFGGGGDFGGGGAGGSW
ncbi:MAG: hypothetical protein DMF70_07985 [Acidobacteria bacterium]|nr:MAG: hypothetical protein DMF70_07985 [Acidobacteriota bacterium]